MSSILVIITLSSIVSAIKLSDPHHCQPYGIRLALGHQFHDSTSPQVLSIWFNTHSKCQKSFVMVQQGFQTRKKVSCLSWKIGFQNYNSFIHRCSVQKLEQGKEFNYMVYGMGGQASELSRPVYPTKMVSHLPNGGEDFRMIVLADWAFLKEKRNKYESLSKSFDYLIQKNIKIDAININGDIAYDLDSNGGQNYEDFLAMLSQVSCRWPVILNAGNHQHLSKKDLYLFNNSFETYGYIENQMTILDLGAFHYILFDPYKIVYEGAPEEPLMEKLKTSIVSQKQKSQKPFIASSHYPILCRGPEKNCVDIEKKLRGIYTTFIDLKISLYIGAHYHSYQRVYPYIGNGQTIPLNPPYTLTPQTNYLLSIVEGIAGTDHGIIEADDSSQPVMATGSFNATGYGILSFEANGYKYEHFTSKDPGSPIDSFQVKLKVEQS